MPKEGWVCFHCGERFTTFGSAEDHFGARPTNIAACRIKIGDNQPVGYHHELAKVKGQQRVGYRCSITGGR